MSLTLGSGTMSVLSLAAETASNGAGGIKDAFLRANFREPASSPMGANSDWLFFWIFVISAFFFVLLMGLMVFFVVKYRRTPGRVPQRSASHNTLLELSWSVIPTILLVWMFFEGFYGYTDKVVAPSNAREIVVTAQKWAFGFTYPNGAASPETTRTRAFSSPAGGVDKDAAGAVTFGAAEIPIFVVPEGEPVKLRMSSVDVMHAFWIPDMRVKFDIMPNRFTSMWFQSTGIDREKALAKGWKLERTVTDEKTNQTRRVPFVDEKGEQYLYEDHFVFCAEYCGSLHSEMNAVMRVVPVAAYEQIVRDWAEPKGTPEQVGAALYKIKGCNACHSVDGSRNVGPTWKDIYGEPVEFADNSSISASQMTGVDFDNYIRESIYVPQAKIVKGYPNQMQSYQGRINDKELSALIAYMKSLSAKAPRPAEGAAPAEGGKPGGDAPGGTAPAAPSTTGQGTGSAAGGGAGKQ